MSSTVGADAAAAAQAAQISPGQIATLILPSDTSWNEGGIVAEALPRLPTPLAAPSQVDEAAAILRRGGEGVVLLIGYAGLTEEGLALADRIRQATGCRLIADTSGRIPRGQGRPLMERVPYVVDVAVAAMKETRAPHPLLGEEAGDLLRLSGQAADLDPGSDRGAPAGAQGAGSDRCAGQAGRGARSAEGRCAEQRRARRDRDGGADAEVLRDHRRGADPGRGGDRGQVDHLRARAGRLHQGLGAARLDEPERRGDRRRHADVDRRGGGRA